VVYEIVLSDGVTEVIRGATGYVQEGPLTTFFSSSRSHAQIDSRSDRLGSVRTADIRRIVLREVEAAGLRAVPDGIDDGYGHYVFAPRSADRAARAPSTAKHGARAHARTRQPGAPSRGTGGGSSSGSLDMRPA
jgi:hypothetical protein